MWAKNYVSTDTKEGENMKVRILCGESHSGKTRQGELQTSEKAIEIIQVGSYKEILQLCQQMSDKAKKNGESIIPLFECGITIKE